MKLRYIAILMILLPVANASLEKPNWGVGDYWEYNGSLHVYNQTSYENISLSVEITTTKLSLKIEVVGVEIIDVQEHGYPCYKTFVTISSRGLISINGNLGNKPINYNGNFEIGGSGYIYFTTSGLEMVKNDININFTTNIPLSAIPTGATNAIVEYTPPLDFMDFPVEKGEKWNAEADATFYTGNMSSTIPVSYSFECLGRQGNMYIISSEYNPTEQMFPVNTNTQNTFIYWDKDKGMIYQIKNNDNEMSMDLKLVSYKYSNITNIPPVADFTYTPENPVVGNNVIFDSGPSHDEDGRIISYFWEFGDGKNSTKASPAHVYTSPGKYHIKLTVMDNYGATSTKEIVLKVEGGGGNGGKSDSNGTPGFELTAVLLAIAIIILRKFSIFK